MTLKANWINCNRPKTDKSRFAVEWSYAAELRAFFNGDIQKLQAAKDAHYRQPTPKSEFETACAVAKAITFDKPHIKFEWLPSEVKEAFINVEVR